MSVDYSTHLFYGVQIEQVDYDLIDEHPIYNENYLKAHPEIRLGIGNFGDLMCSNGNYFIVFQPSYIRLYGMHEDNPIAFNLDEYQINLGMDYNLPEYKEFENFVADFNVKLISELTWFICNTIS